jgi:AraC-like DNA-binding protein
MGTLIEVVNDQIENITFIKSYSDYWDNFPDIKLFHAHDRHEIVICKTPAAVIFNGEKVVRTGGNIVIFNPAGELHAQLNHPHSHYWRFRVEYPVDFLENILPAETQFHRFFCLSIPDEELETIKPFLDILEHTKDDPEDIWKENRQKYLIVLLQNELYRCVDKMPEAVTTSVPHKDQVIYNICRYIHHHYHDKITLDFLSETYFIPRTTLTRRFRKIVGLSVNEYIQRVRCDYGAQALKAGKSVREVAELCGYPDASYFIRIFEEINGISPKQYCISLKKAKTTQ